jgi:arabinan endo-1,5-alpha-L-arabinosidase
MTLDRRQLLGRGLALGALASVGSRATGANEAVLNDQLTGYLTQLHDPVIIREGDTYHVFGSGGWNHKPSVSWRISTDLHHWTDNGVPFDAIPAWALERIPKATSMWAPDIAHVDRLYRMYYAVSTGGSMNSVIGFATTKTLDRASPDYGWTDHGLVIETHEGGTYNAIDPNFVVDAHGNHWLAFGSYWSGLKLIPLDRATGKPRPGDRTIHSIAYRPAPEGADNPIEGAFIFRHGDYYYLFASLDYCCRGPASNYYVAVGRSRAVTGPYVDKKGRGMMDGYGETVLIERPWGSTDGRGPGHCGLMHDDGRDLIVYHVEGVAEKTPLLRLAELDWSADDWPITRT